METRLLAGDANRARGWQALRHVDYPKTAGRPGVSVSDRESTIEFFRGLDAHTSSREIGGSPVVGIQLRDHPVTNDDLRHLVGLRDELDVVGLEGTQITDEGLHHLCDLSTLDNVDLTNTAVTDAGLAILATIKSLEFVHVEGTGVTPAGIAELQGALPKCEIVWDEM